MCCDGTLFPVAAVTPEEATRFQGRLDLAEDGKTLRLPCPALDGCRCTTYLDRPAVCGAFSCLVLSSLAKKLITNEEAHLAIEELLERRRTLATALGLAPQGQALELARQKILEGTASDEVKEAFRRLKQGLLLLQLQPEDSLFKG